MRRAAAVAAIGILLTGCAQPTALQPSYLGLSDAVASEDNADDRSADVDQTLARIPSNKVLGAMAFQKVTGRSVDPSRLSGRR
jgi:hypothetical protein